MNKVVKRVKDYCLKVNPSARIDAEQLERAIMSMTAGEFVVLQDTDESYYSFIFTATKAYNRHNDLVKGYTDIDKDCMIFTEKSSVTELYITPETYLCLQVFNWQRLEDVNPWDVQHLPIETLKELVFALKDFERLHNVVTEEIEC